MSLTEQITNDLKAAMKAKDKLRISCLRMLKSELKNREVEKGGFLGEDEVRALISSMIRKGKDAAEEFKRGCREDLAIKEEEEISIFYSYLPQQLNTSEIEKILNETISDLSAEGIRDLGKVMKEAMARVAGRAQGKEVNEIAKKLLS